MSRGWAIGTSGGRKALAKEYSHLALNPGLSADEARSLREAAWLKSFKHALSAHSKGDEEIAAAAKFAPWKVAVAHQVRQKTGASVTWLSTQLNLGTPDSARVYLSRAKRQETQN